MAVPGAIGLGLLLISPLGSNIVVRTACCSVGIALPVYSTFKAIEQKDQDEQEKWLVYWAAYGSLSIAELFADKIISWFPFYYHAKFVLLVWLQLPSSNGARQLYMSFLRPFLRKHQETLDQIVEFIPRESSKFVRAFGSEIQFAKTAFLKAMECASAIVEEAMEPTPSRGRPTRGRTGAVVPPAPSVQAQSSHISLSFSLSFVPTTQLRFRFSENKQSEESSLEKAALPQHSSESRRRRRSSETYHRQRISVCLQSQHLH